MSSGDPEHMTERELDPAVQPAAAPCQDSSQSLDTGQTDCMQLKPHPLAAVWPGVSEFTSLSISFLIWKNAERIPSQDCLKIK